MKKTSSLVIFIIFLCALTACVDEKQEIQQETKENQEIVREKTNKDKEKKEDKNFSEDTVMTCNLSGCTEMTEEEASKPLTKSEQGEEYIRLTNRYFEMSIEEVGIAMEIQQYFSNEAIDSSVITTKQKEDIAALGEKYETILNEHLEEWKEYRMNPNLPDNMKKVMESIKSDFIQGTKYNIAFAKQMQRLKTDSLEVTRVKLAEIEEKLKECSERLVIKNEKMEEYFGIDIEKEFKKEFEKMKGEKK